MTNDDYSKVPPPHLLKKFSEQARVDSQKRGHAGYCKTFAKLCIDWALNSKSSPNDCQIRSSDITPSPELAAKWVHTIYGNPRVIPLHEPTVRVIQHAAQWGADQELEACCEWIPKATPWDAEQLRAARRPKSSGLKEQALEALASAPGPEYPSVMTVLNADQHALIRRALEQIDD